MAHTLRGGQSLQTVGFSTSTVQSSLAELIFTSDGTSPYILTLDGANTTGGNIGFGTITPTTPLEVFGHVCATRFVGDGLRLTGIIAAANDNIISGSAYVRALQETSVTGAVKGNALQMAGGAGDIGNTANAGAFTRVGKRFFFCRQ